MKYQRLDDYLQKADLLENWDIFENNQEISFHWSDWDLCSFFLRKKIDDNSYTNIKTLINKTNNLLNQKVIMIFNKKKYEHPLETLYKEYYLQKNNSWFFKDKFKNSQIIYNNEKTVIKDMHWFNQDIYKSYIYIMLLTQTNDFFKMRDFRLRTNFKLSNEINLIQFSRFGLLLEIDDSIYSSLITNKNFKLKIPTFDWTFPRKPKFFEFKKLVSGLKFEHAKQEEVTIDGTLLKYKFGNSSSANIINNKHYWVIPFNQIINGKKIEKSFLPIIETVETHLLNEFDIINFHEDLNKKAA